MRKNYLLLGVVVLVLSFGIIGVWLFVNNPKIPHVGVFECDVCISSSGETVDSPSGKYLANLDIKGTNVSDNYALLFVGKSESDLDQSDPVATFNILESEIGIAWSDVGDILWVIERSSKATAVRPFMFDDESNEFQELELSYFDKLSSTRCIPGALSAMLHEDQKLCY
jgi:hypothetical protein